MKFKPLGDRVLVRRTDEEETSEGGIVIPGSAAEKPSQGEVLAVGPGKTLDNGEIQAVSVKKGDMVVFGSFRVASGGPRYSAIQWQVEMFVFGAFRVASRGPRYSAK